MENYKNNFDNNQLNSINIMESHIISSEPTQQNTKKGITKSVSPYMRKNEHSLKDSIMPLGNFGEIPEVTEEYINNEDTKDSNNINDDIKNIGSNYMGEGYDEEEAKKEIIKEKKKKMNQSRLKTSFNVFSFTNKDDVNYVNDLKNEINVLYKNRDKMEDQITIQQEKIDSQEQELKASIIQNNELKRLIEEKNKEIEQLKNK